MKGNVITYKARLVAKGYRQRQGIDYDKTFSSLAMLKSKRIILVIAAHYDYEIWKMDVKKAFCKGNISKDVYTYNRWSSHLKMVVKYANFINPFMY